MLRVLLVHNLRIRRAAAAAAAMSALPIGGEPGGLAGTYGDAMLGCAASGGGCCCCWPGAAAAMKLCSLVMLLAAGDGRRARGVVGFVCIARTRTAAVVGTAGLGGQGTSRQIPRLRARDQTIMKMVLKPAHLAFLCTLYCPRRIPRPSAAPCVAARLVPTVAATGSARPQLRPRPRLQPPPPPSATTAPTRAPSPPLHGSPPCADWPECQHVCEFHLFTNIMRPIIRDIGLTACVCFGIVLRRWD
jgi:hypothetical protein